MEKICGYCGKEFNTSKEHRKYCSQECKNQVMDEYNKQYRLKNREKHLERQKQYDLDKKGRKRL